jgi:hypothetical protein
MWSPTLAVATVKPRKHLKELVLIVGDARSLTQALENIGLGCPHRAPSHQLARQESATP